MGGELRILTLNISGPAVERAYSLADYLLTLGPEVLVLTETRANPGTEQLLAALGEAGYGSVAPGPPTAGERGVAVLGRVPLSAIEPPPRVDLPHRLVDANAGGMRLLAVYVPSRDATQAKIERKRRFLEQLLAAVKNSAESGRVLLVGDLNVISREHEPKYSTFRTWEYDALDDLAGLDMVDVFAELHPGVQAHSWIGRTGNGYRYDYAFASRDLMGSVRECEYLHEPRESGLSDHAALLLKLTGLEQPPDDIYEWELDCWKCAGDAPLYDFDAGLLDPEPTSEAAAAAVKAHQARRHGGANTVNIHRRLKSTPEPLLACHEDAPEGT